MYTHEIYTTSEPHFLNDLEVPHFQVTNRDSYKLAVTMKIYNKAGIVPFLHTRVFIYDDEYEEFEFTCMILGIKCVRLTK